MRSINILLTGLTLGLANAGAEPNAAEIQSAMNDGIQLQHSNYQKLDGLRIEKGGETADGSYLYLCRAKLVWTLSSKDLLKELKREMDAAIERQAGTEGVGKLFKGMAPIAIALVATQLGEFEAGGVVAETPVRVSLVKAGDDWIVVDLTFPKGFKNPLDKVDLDGGDSK